MTELLAVIAPLLLIDALNPVLFALLIYAAGTSRPVANSSALLLGHTLAYFVVGLLASTGIEKLAARLDNPQPIDFVIEFVLGMAFLYAALATRKGGASESRNPEGELTPFKCLTYGAIVNFIGAPFALPYLAVISEILQANLSTARSVTVLAGYNALYALPFTLVPGLIAVIGDRAKPVLDKINKFLERSTDLLMPWLMLGLALWLLADVYTYLTTGAPL
jgi:threonine/homoserine/homoserine lactone efflux protein